MTRSITYQCTRCPAQHTAPIDSALAMLSICKTCQAARFAAGLKAQKMATEKTGEAT